MINHYWNTTAVALYVDNTLLGYVQTTSDENLKHSIVDLDYGALDRISRLKPVSFRWKEQGIYKDDGRTRPGFTAQNVRDAIPEAITETEDQPPHVDDRAVLATMVKAVQELAWKVGELESRLKDHA